MIKLPKEILRTIQTIEENGFEAWTAGEAVCRSLLGLEPAIWEIITSAPPEQIRRLFPDAQGDEGDSQLFYRRMDGVEFALNCGKEPEQELRRRSFTVWALADHPAKGLLDPTGGKKDLDARLARTIEAPRGYFQKNPLMILKGIALAAELNLDLEIETFNAMKSNASLLAGKPKARVRELFFEILESASPARGLRFSVAAGIMPYVLGEECYPPKSKHEVESFNTLMEKFDDIRQGIEYRLLILLQCFETRKVEAGLEYMELDGETAGKYRTALKKVQDLYFITRPHDFKRFLYQNGMEQYEYWENLARQQRKIYDLSDNRILSRYYMLQEFQQYKMAVFPEDLAVTRQDLLEVGISESKADLILEKLLYIVHYKPRLNTKEKLLTEARRIRKNPLAGFMRDVHFMK